MAPDDVWFRLLPTGLAPATFAKIAKPRGSVRRRNASLRLNRGYLCSEEWAKGDQSFKMGFSLFLLTKNKMDS